MIEQIFSIYDSKAELYGPPIKAHNKGSILRSFQDVANNPEDPIGKHPEDFTLFHIAEFDSATGKYKNLPAPVSVGTAHEFIKQPDALQN